ncbi:MAG TPA: TlpA disulfide reductase family protein [Chitinophagaceae bacterium]|nr:TlpA disulfide reductase family protein [Chitinophagaceae bacterium]
MKYIFTLFLVTSFAARSQQNFLIRGTVDGNYEGPVILYYKKDTLRAVVKDHSFSITGSVNRPERYILTIPGSACGSMLYIENSKIDLSIRTEYKETTGKYCAFVQEVSGSVSDSIARSFNKKRYPPANMPRPADVKQLVSDFVRQNPGFGHSALLIYDHMTLYGPNWAKDMYALLTPAAIESEYGQLLHDVIRQDQNNKPGSRFAPFSMKDTSNQVFHSASLQGKYVLYEFWASWCGPCRKENPTLIANYSRFHRKGFEIVSISLDHVRERWTEAIRQDKLPWIHVSDLQGGNNALGKRHFVTSIPFNILVDPSGNIVATSLRGDQLTRKLNSIFRK